DRHRGAGPGGRRLPRGGGLRGARRPPRHPLLPPRRPRVGRRPAREGAQPHLAPAPPRLLPRPPDRGSYTTGVLLDHRRGRRHVRAGLVRWGPAAAWAAFLFFLSSRPSLSVPMP